MLLFNLLSRNELNFELQHTKKNNVDFIKNWFFIKITSYSYFKMI